jgi:hypothetical protein
MKQEREIERREVEGTGTPPTNYRSMKRRRARLDDDLVMPSQRHGRLRRGAGTVMGTWCSDGERPSSMPVAWQASV